MAKTTLRCKEPIYDFDWSSLMLVMEKQLKNISHALENGHCIDRPKLWRKVRTMYNLCERLRNKCYLERYILGGIVFINIEGTDFSEMKCLLKEKEQKWNLYISDQCEKRRNYDKELLLKLLSKHLFYMWD